MAAVMAPGAAAPAIPDQIDPRRRRCTILQLQLQVSHLLLVAAFELRRRFVRLLQVALELISLPFARELRRCVSCLMHMRCIAPVERSTSSAIAQRLNPSGCSRASAAGLSRPPPRVPPVAALRSAPARGHQPPPPPADLLPNRRQELHRIHPLREAIQQCCQFSPHADAAVPQLEIGPARGRR